MLTESILADQSREPVSTGVDESFQVRTKMLRLLMICSYSTPTLDQFSRRLQNDLPSVAIAAIVRKEDPKPGGIGRWFRRKAALLARIVGAGVRNSLHLILRYFHAVPSELMRTQGADRDVPELCAKHGISFYDHASSDPANWPMALREVAADLVLLLGPNSSRAHPVARPPLPVIAARREVVLDGRGDTGEERVRMVVQVYRSRGDDSSCNVLAERSFILEPYDTESGLELKARLLEIDCFVDALRAEMGAQPAPDSRPCAVLDLERSRLGRERTISEPRIVPRLRFRPTSTRPWYKLAVRLLAYPAIRWRNRRYAKQQRFPVIILFHHVVTDRPKRLGMPTEQFLRHVRFLKKHYKIASMPEALEMLRRGTVPFPTVVLTFDDGYEDNFLCLRAVTEAENVPVALFVCTQKVSERAAFDHDLARGESAFPALGWDALRYLERHQVTIGSHTRTHLDCNCTDPEILRQEIVGSREDLHRELGHDVVFFSFPKGKPENMSAPARAIAGQTYPYLFSACGGVNHAPLVPGAILNRCNHPDSLLELELLMQKLLNFPERGSRDVLPYDR
jgi:peptidoglycan/xylan/chitin deacetylase (PgdA/CDA1 family)